MLYCSLLRCRLTPWPFSRCLSCCALLYISNLNPTNHALLNCLFLSSLAYSTHDQFCSWTTTNNSPKQYGYEQRTTFGLHSCNNWLEHMLDDDLLHGIVVLYFGVIGRSTLLLCWNNDNITPKTTMGNTPPTDVSA
jgi:hypothetical protein